MQGVSYSEAFWQMLWHFMHLWIVVTENQFCKYFHLKWKHFGVMFVNMYMAHINRAACSLAFERLPLVFGQASAWGGAAWPSIQLMIHWSSQLKERVHGLCQGPRENTILFQVTLALRRMKNLQMWPQSFQSKQLHHKHCLPTSVSLSANFKLPFFKPRGNQRFEWTFNYLSSQRRLLEYNWILWEV